jgi:hypothetical protein
MRESFSGLIALVILGIYVYFFGFAYLIVDCASEAGCTTRSPEDFNDLMANGLATIGGLISALIVAQLAVTKPGKFPTILISNSSGILRRILQIVTGLYILVWVIAGIAAYIKSVHYPKVLPPFTDIGQSWFGLAVAAAYAYLRIEPEQ